MSRDRVVLGDLASAVMVVIVGIGDVRAMTVLDLDLEPVANMPGIIDRIEVVDAAIRDAGAERLGEDRKSERGRNGDPLEQFVRFHRGWEVCGSWGVGSCRHLWLTVPHSRPQKVCGNRMVGKSVLGRIPVEESLFFPQILTDFVGIHDKIMTTTNPSMPMLPAMTASRSALKRFLFHSLWVVLPFLGLTALAWSAWRADANTRRSRLLESAIGFSDIALTDVSSRLGPWTAIPESDRTSRPPLPDDDPKAREARKRYETGDFEGVLGSPESLRSAAGLPLRSLGALQLMRKETDPARLTELAKVLTESMDFASPPFLDEAERRFNELKLPIPPSLAQWRNRWQRTATEATLSAGLDESDSASWKESEGVGYFVEIQSRTNEWRVTNEADLLAAAAPVYDAAKKNLADGLDIHLSAAGKTIAGTPGLIPLSARNNAGWRAEVVLADEAAYVRGDEKTRNFMTAVIGVAALALAFGLVLAGRAYVRAVELAHRQAEFMAAVSHEMRTPIAAMGLLSENLESGVAERAGQREEHTKLIREECARLGGLVDNVLAFTRGQKPEPFEAFDVPAMVEDAAALVQPLARRRSIDLEIKISKFTASPDGEVSALRRAVLNLLDNAVKHTPHGGKVTCTALEIDESSWQIEVSDNGPGIPLGERKRIFDAFYRIGDELRRTTPGTGLGLALVKRTAETHGGSIKVNDAPGGGARFTLSLPFHPIMP